MESTNSTMTTPTQEVGVGVTGVLLFIQILSLFLNWLVLYLMARLGWKQLDRSLAVVVAVADILLSTYKIVMYVYIFSHGNDISTSVYSSVEFCQFDGFVHQAVTSVTGLGIGYLALVRFWVIVLRKNFTIWIWATLFISKVVFIVVVTIAAAAYHDFEFMQITNYNLIKIRSENVVTNIASITCLVYQVAILFVVNFCYISIAIRYYVQIASLKHKTMNSASVVAYEHFASKNQKLKVVLKIMLILIIYTLLIAPATVVTFIEVITAKRRSTSIDMLQGVLLLLVPLFNPIFLITLHSETWLETVKLFTSLKCKLLKTDQKPIHDSFSSSSLSLSDKPLHLESLNSNRTHI